MGYLSVCAIAKDEDAYFPEWITYYRIMGATHFFIYDNGSRIPISQSLASLNHGDITVIPFPGRGRQVEAYTDAIGRASGRTTWLAFLDLDEYLIPKKTLDLKDVLSDYESYGALVAHWLMFGSSGRTTKPECLQLEAYTKRNPVQSKVNEHVKSIVRPERVRQSVDPHFFLFKEGFHAVNENKIRVAGPFSQPVSTEIIQVNHYFTRTLEEYKVKIAKGSANNSSRKDLSLFDATNREATESDSFARRFSFHVTAALSNERLSPNSGKGIGLA